MSAAQPEENKGKKEEQNTRERANNSKKVRVSSNKKKYEPVELPGPSNPNPPANPKGPEPEAQGDNGEEPERESRQPEAEREEEDEPSNPTPLTEDVSPGSPRPSAGAGGGAAGSNYDDDNNNNRPVLSDSTDYAVIRQERGIPDPFELYYSQGWEPTRVSNQRQDDGTFIPVFHLLSPIVPGEPRHKVRYILGEEASYDEQGKLLHHHERKTAREGQKTSSGVTYVSGDAPGPDQGEVDAAVYHAQSLPSSRQQDSGGGGWSSGGGPPRPGSEESQRLMRVAEIIARAEQAGASQQSINELKKDFGLEHVKPGDLTQDSMLAWAKGSKDRTFIAHLLEQNRNVTTVLNDVGLQSLLVCFQMADITGAEAKSKILSFRDPDEVIRFVSEKLTDAFAAAKDPILDQLQDVRETAAGWLNYAKNLEIQSSNLQFELEIEKFNHNLAVYCLNDEGNRQYQILRNMSDSGQRGEVRDLMLSRQRSMTHGNGDPGPLGPYKDLFMPKPFQMPAPEPPPQRPTMQERVGQIKDMRQRMKQFQEHMKHIAETQYPDLSPEYWAEEANRMKESREQGGGGFPAPDFSKMGHWSQGQGGHKSNQNMTGGQ